MKLESFFISSVPITTKALKQLLNECSNLERIRLSCCAQVSPEELKPALLETLGHCRLQFQERVAGTPEYEKGSCCLTFVLKEKKYFARRIIFCFSFLFFVVLFVALVLCQIDSLVVVPGGSVGHSRNDDLFEEIVLVGLWKSSDVPNGNSASQAIASNVVVVPIELSALFALIKTASNGTIPSFLGEQFDEARLI
jgi:hypothetical protein